MEYIPVFVIVAILVIGRLLARKYPKLGKLNKKLNKRFANHKDDTNPATGLPMLNKQIDIWGNYRGFSDGWSGHDDYHSTNDD